MFSLILYHISAQKTIPKGKICITVLLLKRSPPLYISYLFKKNMKNPKAYLKLYALCADAEYIFEDADGGSFEAKGSDLLEGRFAFTVSEKRKAKIYFYKKK